jgi:hypothetical protein
MKIRIRGNTVRYRLTQSEVKAISETGYFEEKTHFTNGKILTYALKSSTGINQLDATFDGDTITMLMPEKDAREWFNNNQVGYENDSASGSLHLLLEKDIVCLDETVEDQSDNYPHPYVDSHK